MKAAQINEYGNSSVIEINEVDIPAIKSGQVVIQVNAASINPFDSTVRAGYLKDKIPLTFPATLGGDISGIITDKAEDVSSIALGDSVYGQANVIAGNSGAFAEYAATSAGQIAVAPANLDFIQSASIPLVGVSALQALTEHIELKSGQKLFIHGGAGGIGSIAIQIAKNIGAYVAVTATGEGLDFVKDLGADEIIDYKNQDFSEILKDYDAVFEAAGGKEFDKTLSVLKPGGVGVSMIASADEQKLIELGITAFTQSTHVTTQALDELRILIEKNVVVPQVDEVFPLSEIKKAFEQKENGIVKGKIVIQITG